MEHKLVSNCFPKAADVLKECITVIEDRGAIYGDNPVDHAKLSSLLLGGIPPGDVQKASMFNMLLIKISRYGSAARNGRNQDDSLIDIINYAAALLVIDREQRAEADASAGSGPA